MRTETTVRTLYAFDELSAEAQERAIEQSIERWDFCWCDEWRQSLDVFLDTFPVRLAQHRTPWEVGAYSHAWCTTECTDDDVADMVGVRLWKWLHAYGLAARVAECCPFTGYCGDESILKPLRAFLERPNTSTTGAELFQECATAWAKGYRDDLEGQLSEEYHREMLEGDPDECFTEDGRYA